MDSSDQIADDEVVYRRIPSTAPWFEPPSHISSANFKLDRRRYEKGISVYRRSAVSAKEVLETDDAQENSFIAKTTVGEIRSLKNGKGEPLKLNVVICDDEDNPGHAEIRGPETGKLSPAASKALKDVFELVDPDDA